VRTVDLAGVDLSRPLNAAMKSVCRRRSALAPTPGRAACLQPNLIISKIGIEWPPASHKKNPTRSHFQFDVVVIWQTFNTDPTRRAMTHLSLISIGILFLGLCLTLLIWRQPAWLGWRGKTLWDWMIHLATPIMVGAGAILLGLVQMNIEHNRSQEESLQRYVDRVSVLATKMAGDTTATAVARAHTLAILHQLDRERAGRMLSFLGELGLLQRLAPTLEFMDFSGANLKRLSLRGMDFEGSNLRRAELERADLRGADFEAADLRKSDLKDADLRGANLTETRIDAANFDHADLRGADLLTATGATPEQLRQACLDATTILPKAMALAVSSATGCTGSAQDN
jgi:hypothetical protein